MAIKVTSNGIPLILTKNNSTKLKETNKENLKQSFKENGYVYLKNFLDVNKILNLRKKYFSLFPKNSILKENSTEIEGLSNGKKFYVPHGIKGHPAYNIVRKDEFNELAHETKILNLISQISNNKNIKVLKRKIIRHFYQHSNIASKAHIDYTYLNKGTQNVFTAWIPLGDCNIETGGLIYLQNSHNLKLESVKVMFPESKDKKWITNDLANLAKKTCKKWMYSDYKAGDIVIHSPFLIHASLDCSSVYMRLSTDIRYVTDNEKVDKRWSNNWSADDGH